MLDGHVTSLVKASETKVCLPNVISILYHVCTFIRRNSNIENCFKHCICRLNVADVGAQRS